MFAGLHNHVSLLPMRNSVKTYDTSTQISVTNVFKLYYFMKGELINMTRAWEKKNLSLRLESNP